MEPDWKAWLWRQFGAAIDMVENAMLACPDELWDDRSREPEFWALVHHTLFWLDYYLADEPAEYAPPAPFGLEELDPAGVLPPRPYTREELRAWLRHGRARCRAVIEGLTPEGASRRYAFKMELSRGELLLYNLRHVQHHAAQLNLLLRQATGSAPRWVWAAQDGEGHASATA